MRIDIHCLVMSLTHCIRAHLERHVLMSTVAVSDVVTLHVEQVFLLFQLFQCINWPAGVCFWCNCLLEISLILFVLAFTDWIFILELFLLLWWDFPMQQFIFGSRFCWSCCHFKGSSRDRFRDFRRGILFLIYELIGCLVNIIRWVECICFCLNFQIIWGIYFNHDVWLWN